jgi:hypothetical protein
LMMDSDLSPSLPSALMTTIASSVTMTA